MVKGQQDDRLVHPDGLIILCQCGVVLEACTEALECQHNWAGSRVCRPHPSFSSGPQIEAITPFIERLSM